MARAKEDADLLFDQSQPLVHDIDDEEERPSRSSLSTTSLVLEHVNDKAAAEALSGYVYAYKDKDGGRGVPQEELDMEDQLAWKRSVKPAEKKARRVFLFSFCHRLAGLGRCLRLVRGTSEAQSECRTSGTRSACDRHGGIWEESHAGAGF